MELLICFFLSPYFYLFFMFKCLVIAAVLWSIQRQGDSERSQKAISAAVARVALGTGSSVIIYFLNHFFNMRNLWISYGILIVLRFLEWIYVIKFFFGSSTPAQRKIVLVAGLFVSFVFDLLIYLGFITKFGIC